MPDGFDYEVLSDETVTVDHDEQGDPIRRRTARVAYTIQGLDSHFTDPADIETLTVAEPSVVGTDFLPVAPEPDPTPKAREALEFRQTQPFTRVEKVLPGLPADDEDALAVIEERGRALALALVPPTVKAMRREGSLAAKEDS